MIDLSLGSLIAYTVFFVAGAFLGVLLGRRSKRANSYVNTIQASAEQLGDKAREEIARAKNRNS